ncbi:MAG: alpha/beta fold hydrolase, partial [Flammeovirgaceae bacterium]|nr:alpha/beta fold hydrolase [Flammeovirgaceae bacterium]
MLQLFYRKLGTTGVPLVILHGVFGSSDNWLTLGKQLAEQYEVFLIDQRNHGLSPHSESFDYEVLCEDLHNFIQHHRIALPVVIGHSMGGKVAMLFALKYPTLLRSLVVVDIAPRAYPPHHQAILKGL